MSVWLYVKHHPPSHPLISTVSAGWISTLKKSTTAHFAIRSLQGHHNHLVGGPLHKVAFNTARSNGPMVWMWIASCYGTKKQPKQRWVIPGHNMRGATKMQTEEEQIPFRMSQHVTSSFLHVCLCSRCLSCSLFASSSSIRSRFDFFFFLKRRWNKNPSMCVSRDFKWLCSNVAVFTRFRWVHTATGILCPWNPDVVVETKLSASLLPDPTDWEKSRNVAPLEG